MIISTSELESIIKDGYSKFKKVAEHDGIFVDLDVLFSEKLPIVFEGDMHILIMKVIITLL